jgi:hypothetical protein
VINVLFIGKRILKCGDIENVKRADGCFKQSLEVRLPWDLHELEQAPL